jgi:predicted ArsR family transcriptional regulator
MPRHTRPRPELSPDLETAAFAFGSREDLAILAFLGRVESAKAPELCDALQMALNTAHRHLGQLESLGLIGVDTRDDTPAGDRRGRTVRYSLDRAATASAVEKMKAALLGGRRG